MSTQEYVHDFASPQPPPHIVLAVAPGHNYGFPGIAKAGELVRVPVSETNCRSLEPIAKRDARRAAGVAKKVTAAAAASERAGGSLNATIHAGLERIAREAEAEAKAKAEARGATP